MFWPALAVLLLAAAIGLHLWWRAKYGHAQANARQQLDRLRETHERAAAQVRQEQEALLNSMVEGLLWLDRNGHIQHANQAFLDLFGVTSQIRSRTIMEALRVIELAELVEALNASLRVTSRELKLVRPKERWLHANASAVFGPGDQREGTLVLVHDVTRLKVLERARQEFVANVSHELRTPLSLIKGYVETLLDGAKDNPEVASKFLQTIDRNAERLRLLIDDLLTISELESGRIKLEWQDVNLRQAVEKVLSDLKARADAKSVTLINQVPDLPVRADTRRLEQVLCNLLDNAIKYGHAQGCITVGARPIDNGLAEVCVKDTGPGIPPAALERVFERFYRVDKARSREQGGTGLGLSIVKHIVQSHGGRAWATSELGCGASFFFTLPVAS